MNTAKMLDQFKLVKGECPASEVHVWNDSEEKWLIMQNREWRRYWLVMVCDYRGVSDE